MEAGQNARTASIIITPSGYKVTHDNCYAITASAICSMMHACYTWLILHSHFNTPLVLCGLCKLYLMNLRGVNEALTGNGPHTCVL